MASAKLTIGFVGCGVMGGPMAGHLVRAGHRVVMANRTPARAAAWAAAHGGAAAATPAAAAAGADLVITCVGNDDDVAAVTLGPDGAYAAMSAGALHIDHSTVSAELAVKLADAAAAHGLAAVDAPVSGGQSGAENGALAVMCGGDAAAVDRARAAMAAYAARIVHIGGPGSGQRAKMVNQIAIAGLLQGLAEAVHFAQRAGLDADRVLEAVSGGAAASWQMANRWPTMVRGEYDFGFAVDLMRKDLGLMLAEARRVGAAVPVAALVDQFYAEVQAAGGGRLDTSALLTRLPT